MTERSAKQVWEAVLAEVEEDVRRTQSQFGAAQIEPLAKSSAAPGPTPATSLRVPPAQTMLPAADGPVLPPLAAMPPVPAELRGRILAVQAHIEALRQNLEDQLTQWLAAPEPHRAPRPQRRPVTPTASRFVDRAL